MGTNSACGIAADGTRVDEKEMQPVATWWADPQEKVRGADVRVREVSPAGRTDGYGISDER